ncbi:MAG TPA: phosphoribosylaminoimidazolesuccinocarboxamide synthase [Pirellulaceae bacterium]|nr:phosphoribosylaminoimidazolesuccinocarboxamide synthase [Pirellulaceae bacterium]
MPALLQSNLSFPVRRGKVRDVYDLGDKLLLVATDRISAFDWVMPNGIPDKGRILTQISAFWFEKLGVPNHLLSLDASAVVGTLRVPLTEDGTRSVPTTGEELAGRSMIVTKTKVVPIECVVRGYLDGSGWKEYQKSGTVCGIKLPSGLVQCSKLPEPIFTPATKEESGHDINISFPQMVEIIGRELAEDLRRRSLDVYTRAAEFARTRGIIIADTKFEWGLVGQVSNLSSQRSEVILIDEVLTPDSSRFWPADQYQPGRGQPSFDKQFVRDWLETTGWDKDSPPPELPADVVAKTRAKYVEAYEKLTGKKFAAV